MILLHSFNVGGAEKSLCILANLLVRRGWYVSIGVMNDQGRLRTMLDSRIIVIELGSGRLRSALLPLIKTLFRTKPKFVLSSIYATALLMLVAKIFTFKNYYSIVGIHNDIEAKIQRPDNKKDAKFLDLSIKMLIRFSDACIGVSTGATKSFQERYSLSKKDCFVAYNPITEISENTLYNLPPLPNKKKILSVGRLVPQKNFETLIEAFTIVLKIHADATLTIVGGGPLSEELIALTTKLNVNNSVYFEGFSDNPMHYYQSSDVFVMSSSWEGFGNTVVEALACGLPVISSNCRFGPSEILCDGQFGVLVEPDNKDALASALIEHLNDPQSKLSDRAALIDRARKFSFNSSVQRYLDIFDEIQAR